MTQPAAPAPMTDIYMPDNACMVQVYRLDEDGLITQGWAVMEPFSDVCEKVTGMFGPALGGASSGPGFAEGMYALAKAEQAAGNAQVVNYG